jgi:hypothetical protein
MAVRSLPDDLENLSDVEIIGRKLSCQIRTYVSLSTSYCSLSQRNIKSSALLQDDTHCRSEGRES